MASRQVKLIVNDAAIALNEFVQGYIDQVVKGILTSLKDTGEVKSVDLSIEENQVSIVLNDAAVPLNPFVSRIIQNTMVGMVSSLKKVSTIERIKINIRK